MLTLAIISAALAGLLGGCIIAYVLSWLLENVCEWVFGLFNERNADSGILIGDTGLLGNIIDGLRERDEEMAERLENALEGGNSKKMMLWQNGKAIENIEIVDASDGTQQDQLIGKVTRFEKNGKILQY